MSNRLLFPDEVVASKVLLGTEAGKNPNTNDVWKRREVDELLDIYLSGADLGRIGVRLGRNRKAILRKIQEYIYNERDRAANYIPRQRLSRAGKRWTENDTQILRECHKKGVIPKQIAAVLARKQEEVEELLTPNKTKAGQDPKSVSSIVDLIWAHRYLYSLKSPVISDKEYDSLVEEETEYGGGGPALEAARQDLRYPHRIRCLAHYLLETYKEKQEGTYYAAGEKLQEGEYGTWYGPIPELSRILELAGKSDRSRVLLLKNKKFHELYRWRKERWRAIQQ